MDDSFFKKLFFDWSKVYYTTPIVIVCSFLAIVFGIKYYQKEKTHILFIIYSISTFLLFLLAESFTIISLKTSRNKAAIIETGNILFEFIELSVFYYFFLQIINSNVVRLIMKSSFIVFLILVILFFLIPIFTYFFELFTKDPVNDIFYSPSLWITSGLFLYCLSTLPFLLISDSLGTSNRSLYFLMFSIHFLSLSLLFLTIIKAFTCKKPITT